MAEPATFVLEARALTVVLGGVRALDGLDLVLEPGLRSVVLGPNGAGKSVLLRALHGLLRPTSGTIAWRGRNGRPPRLAMVFQRPVMLRRSGLANIRYALAVNGVREPGRSRRAAEALERMGLTAIGDRPARALSGGEQQRLAIARAVVARPAILVADEPTAHLDDATAADIAAMFHAFNQVGVTVLVATHHEALFAPYMTRRIVLSHGRLLA